MNKLSGTAFREEVRQLQKRINKLSAELEEEQQLLEWQHEREQVQGRLICQTTIIVGFDVPLWRAVPACVCDCCA